MSKRLYSISNLTYRTSGGTWTLTVASNVWELVKTPADNTTTLTIDIPSDVRNDMGHGIKGLYLGYTVGVASLDAAPTATLYKVSMAPSTKIITAASASTAAIAFAGTNTVGTAAGDYTAYLTFNGTLMDPAAAYTLAVAFNAAATSALKVTGLEVEFA